MTSIFIRGASSKRPVIVAALAFGAAILAIQPAAAQRAQAGPYGVARAGVQFDSDLRLGSPLRSRTTTTTRPGTPTQTPTPVPASPLGRKVDADLGFTGELGAGYDFGGFRLEGTVGYGSASVNDKRLSNQTAIGDGRLKSFDLGMSGYIDFNSGGVVKPFIGGGIGASRVSAEVSRLGRPTTTTTPRPGAPTTPTAPRAGTSIDQKDWGLRWHADAGFGYEVSPGTTLELAGRYARTTSLDMTSSTRTVTGATFATTTAAFKPRLSSTSLMLGLRQRF